jgi:hypothetical protein
MTVPTTARRPAGGALKDKRVLYGGGAIVAVALFALYKRGNAGATTAAAPSSGTTGTDIASALSDYNAQNQSAMAGYVQQVQSLVDSVKNGTTSSTSTPSSGPAQPAPGSVSVPAPKVGVKAPQHYVVVVGKSDKSMTVGKLIDTYHLTLAQIRNLNPALRNASTKTVLGPSTKWTVS